MSLRDYNDDLVVPITNWKYYFSVRDVTPVSSLDELTLEELYQLFVARLYAEQKGERL